MSKAKLLFVLKWAALVLLLGAGLLFALVYQSDIPLAELKAKYANDESQFVEIEGMSIHYRDEGQGAPLLLLHGSAASLHTWDGWVKELSNEFRIVRLDLPAFGLTGPEPSDNYSYERYVELIHAFVQAIGLRRFHLAGSSLGGGIAWHFAVTHPEQVEKLILVDPTGYPKEPPLLFRLAGIPVVNWLFEYVAPRALVQDNLRQVYGDPSKITPQLISRYRELALRPGNRRALVERVRTNFIKDPSRIREISMPTLVLWGQEDHWIPLSHAYRFSKELPNGKLIVYPGVGHMPMEEIPKQSAEDARRFLKAD